MKYIVILFFILAPLGAQTRILWGGIYSYGSSADITLTEDEKALGEITVQEVRELLLNKNISITVYSGSEKEKGRIADRGDMDDLNGFLNREYRFGIYGFNRKDDFFYDVEIRIYDFVMKADVKTFYFRYETGDRLPLAEDISKTLEDYFLTILDYFEEEQFYFTEESLRLSGRGGYWTYMVSDLSAYDIPVFTLGVTAEYIPSVQVSNALKPYLYPSFGYQFDFYLSKTARPDVYYDHSLFGFEQKLPALLNLKFPRRFNLYAGIAPGFLIESFVQDRGSLGMYNAVSTSFVLSFITGFQLLLGKEKRWFVGVDIEPQLTFNHNGTDSRFIFTITTGYLFKLISHDNKNGVKND